MNPNGGEKYGESTTHWQKLVPRVNLGGGGECPLLLIGIEPDRVGGVDDLLSAQEKLHAADEFKVHWREQYAAWKEAKPVYDQMIAEAYSTATTSEDTEAL